MNSAARLKVRVIPNARISGFSGFREDEVVLRLKSPAVEGKANKAAIEFLANFFAVSKARTVLVSGEKSRHKIFEIIGLDAGELERKLASLEPLAPQWPPVDGNPH